MDDSSQTVMHSVRLRFYLIDYTARAVHII